MPKRLFALAFALAACGAPADRDPESSSGGGAPASLTTTDDGLGNLGTVRLETACSEVADKHAGRGLALLHHMTYIDAQESFAKAVEADPGCTFGYWGQAMTIIHPLWPDVPDAEGLERGQELVALARAQTSPEGREDAYLATVEAYFRDADQRGERERLADFEAAWRVTAEANPDDLEARSLYALSRLATASLTDKTYAQQFAALDLLDDVLEAIPDHPGAHHYTIHARDFPPLAKEGLEVARAYARLAPDLAHSLHMPTHIYTRVGNWDESIEGNNRSADASWEHGRELGGIATDFHHALDYLVYAHLQKAEDEKARTAMERAIAADGPWVAVNMPAIAYALAAIPARYALERRDWDAAANLVPRRPVGFPWNDGFAPFEGVTHFAKALGGARGGDYEVAREAIAALDVLSERVAQTSSNAYWTGQIQVQSLAARAWLAFETGDRAGGLDLMQQAARIEAASEKGPVTPGELIPAAELLGEMLLEMGQGSVALIAFEAALRRSPARLNGLAGAAKAARADGQEDLAADYYRQLLELTTEAEVEREAMVEAREFLAEVGP